MQLQENFSFLLKKECYKPLVGLYWKARNCNLWLDPNVLNLEAIKNKCRYLGTVALGCMLGRTVSVISEVHGNLKVSLVFWGSQTPDTEKGHGLNTSFES